MKFAWGWVSEGNSPPVFQSDRNKHGEHGPIDLLRFTVATQLPGEV